MTIAPATGLSVIIPVYKRADTLPRAVASIQAQPGIDPEIIVVDDGSRDAIQLDGLDGDRIRIVRSDGNRGGGPVRNLGVAHASHHILAFLDADDEWLPGSARARLRLLEPGTCVVGSHVRVDDVSGYSSLELLPHDLSRVLRVRNPIHPSGLVISRKDFDLLGGFPMERNCAEDWVFFLRAINGGIRIRASSDPVVVVHVGGANTTSAPETLAHYALGAIRQMEAEGLVNRRELLRARRATKARVAGFYANAARIQPSVRHLRDALPGVMDPVVVRELAYVPIQAIRGAARRRWRTVRRPQRQPHLPQVRSGPLVVVVANPAEAWIRRAVEGLTRVAPQINVVEAPKHPGRRTRGIARWRIRRSGEPDAREVAPIAGGIQPHASSDLPLLTSHAAAIVDLSGRETYRPEGAADPPAVRVRFGSQGSLHTRWPFDAALVAAEVVDRISVTLESQRDLCVLQAAPAVIDLTSYSLSWNGALWKAAAVLPRAVSALLSDRTQPQHVAENNSTFPGERLVARAVTGARFSASAAEQLLTRERWGVAVLPFQPSIPATDVLATASPRWTDSRDSIADPCLHESAGKTYLFAEHIRPGRPGVIAVTELDDAGAGMPLEDVLVEDHHLSYPMVLEDEGDVWLIPESSSARNVRLFRAEEFPRKWSCIATLLDEIVAFDPTVHRNEDGYWLWVCVAPHGRGRNDELWLFHSDALAGPWRSHPANPVVEDPRRARPAGRLFVAEGRLIRPGQDCSTRYGRRIVLNEVLELSAERYRERPIATIDPSWYPGLTATHTISRAGAWQAVDGARRVLDPFSPRAGVHL